ncbi:MAG TPA: carbamoyltransferase C-terminal domain-containing protein [Dehalococcoidia bacterium]|nr:carbamoyltransferase C-terminal domain-containing protein [Dehalococcoidia bacterium]
MYTLGINAAFHDSSAALLRDGEPVAAAEDERFTRIKHGKRPVPFLSYQLPFHAIDYCLREAGIPLRAVDQIAYSFDPSLCLDGVDPETLALPLEPSAQPREDGRHPWEPLFLAGIVNAPRFLVDDIPHHLKTLRQGIASHDELPPFRFVEHHMAHAASAFYVSGFKRAAVLTMDGRGELASTSFAVGDGARLTKLNQVEIPHSLGLLYERVTAHLGFLHSSDEYKVMALASYGSERFFERFSRFVRVFEDGRYEIDAIDLENEFGPACGPVQPVKQWHYDLAAALQHALEESVLEIASRFHSETGIDELCLAGGVALNCVMNGRLRDEGPFRSIFVQPAAGDAGTALGAAYLLDAEVRNQPSSYAMTHAYLGPYYAESEIRSVLDGARLEYTRPDDIADAVAELLTQDRIVGWFQGRMEFGPRALGARSILAAPVDPDMKDRLNAIKHREEFRPVAPAVMEERLSDYFEANTPDPFMLFVANVRADKADQIPAVRHIDGTARVQSVSQGSAPMFHRVIERFEKRSGVPVVINTSFNTRGEPIVCTPEDALACYFTTALDALAMGPYLLRKR